MKIFDSHCHIETGFENYNMKADVKNIIFNSVESYKAHNSNVTPGDVRSIIFDYRNHFDYIKELTETRQVQALKIHSRIQKLSEHQYPALIEKLEELRPGIPIIIDSFFYGEELDFQPSLKAAINIAKKFSNVPVIIAHAGGYNALKYFYHLKPLENIYFELSFSLAYLQHTSVFTDIKNLLKFGSSERILFGTDYPFANPGKQLHIFTKSSEELKLTDKQASNILFENANRLFTSK